MNAQPLRVWLVDDDTSIRWVLERALKNGGMLPKAFDAAEPALAALRNDTPDVLITDIRMSGQSGLDLLRRVHDAHPELPVIVMTAYSDLGSAVSAYESGAFEYLAKPFDIDQAVDLVMAALAFVLSVCSTVDAFLALSFARTFTPGSILTFLTFGPMVDIKSTMMYLGLFKRRVVLYMVILPLLISVLIGIWLNLNVRF